MKNIPLLLGKFLYGITFLVFLPTGLWFWEKYTKNLVMLPAYESKPAGLIFITGGAILIFWGMLALKIFGKGLPMNAFPPVLFVANGPYRLFKHPIYAGFGILLIGWAFITGSASGLWLVAPLTILGMIALVLGYEDIDLQERFPDQRIKTIMELPENSLGSPDLRDRLATQAWVVLFLAICNFLIQLRTTGIVPLFGEPLRLYSGFENPLLPFLSFILILILPFTLKRKDLLREWSVSAIISLFCLAFIALLYPEVGAQYLPDDGFYLSTVPIFLLLLAFKAVFRQYGGSPFSVLALFVLISIQLINSHSAILHVINATVIFLLSANYMKIWIFLKKGSEKLANSWKEWVFGKVRVINHGFYVGFGGFFGILLAGILAGKDFAPALLVSTLLLVICAALWAQFIEGSAKLKRPFGFYGGLVGISLGAIVVWAMGVNVWVVIGACTVVMPWIQALGRLRCLVNGCCHGRRIDDPQIGIRIVHPRSRVCNISGLKGELIHATQLYSILWLSWVGILLLTLWNKNISIPLIFGLYLILINLGRFVEEAYRGEVQTPIFRGLHLYQWTAILFIIIGIALSVIRIDPPALTPGISWEAFFAALISGLFIFFAMGVDFPTSNARFSRLV